MSKNRSFLRVKNRSFLKGQKMVKNGQNRVFLGYPKIGHFWDFWGGNM